CNLVNSGCRAAASRRGDHRGTVLRPPPRLALPRRKPGPPPGRRRRADAPGADRRHRDAHLVCRGVRRDHQLRRPGRAPHGADDRRAGAPRTAPSERAGRRPRPRRRGPGRPGRCRPPGGAFGHHHRTGRRPVLLLAAVPDPRQTGRLGMKRIRQTMRAVVHGSGLRRLTPPQRVTSGTVVLGARHLSKSYGARTVLDDVSLDVRTGEVLALVGPNGAGKSTLLSILTGDTPPDRGEVTVLDRPLAAWSPAELALRRAVLPQSFTVSFPFDVVDVVH